MADKASDNPGFELDEYYDKIHRATWIRRVAGMMTGITIFGSFGAVGGAIASFVPYVLGALKVGGAAAALGPPGIAAIASSAALFAGAFALMGMVTGMDVSANAASVSAGLSRKEKLEREKEGLPEPSKAKPKKESIIYMPRVALFTVPLGAAFGALLGFTGLAPSIALLGFQGATAATATAAATAATPAAIIASSVIFGLFGATIGFNAPMFSNKLNTFYSRLITDNLFVNKLEKVPSSQPARADEKEIISVIEDRPRSKFFAQEKKISSLLEIVEKSREQTPDMVIRR